MDEQELIQEGRGRSAKKRAAKAVEDLARQLVELPDQALEGLPLTDAMRRELDQARATKGHSSRRRQIKHFAGCLRRDDDQREAIENALSGHQVEQARERHAFHSLEELRNRLCDAEQFAAALDEVASTLPTVDRNKLSRLARSVHATGDKKAAREIFRRLRLAAEE